MVLTTGKKFYRKKGTVVWPAMFFGGFKLQPEKITTRKKKVQLSGQRLKLISDNHLSCQNTNTSYYKTGKNYDPKKKVQSSGHRLEHKTQNTTHTDTTTNKMSRATLPSSGFAPSHSMGRAEAPTNHGAATPQRHVQAASCLVCAHCHWFACLGRRNKRHRIIERGGVPWP